MQTQYKIMKQAVPKCPRMNLMIMNEVMPSLLDPHDMVSLMQHDYCNHYYRLWLRPAEG